MAEFEECGLCGAAMADPEMHKGWHDSVDGDVAKLIRWMKDHENAVQRMQSP